MSRFVDEAYGASLDNVPQSLHQLIAQTRATLGRLDAVCPVVRAVAIEGFLNAETVGAATLLANAGS